MEQDKKRKKDQENAPEKEQGADASETMVALTFDTMP